MVGPEHARTFADGGWSKDGLKRHLYANLRFGKSQTRREPDAMISKFPSTEEIHVVVAGGTAGRFSVAIPGWLGTKNGSRSVTRAL